MAASVAIPQPATAGSFLFVSYDGDAAAGRKADRALINRHAQTHKRLGRPRSAFSAALSPVNPIAQRQQQHRSPAVADITSSRKHGKRQHHPLLDQPQDFAAVCRTCHNDRAESKDTSLPCSCTPYTWDEKTPCLELWATTNSSSLSRTPRSPSSPIMHKGNSDPFSALAIPVDAIISSLVAFERDCLQPSLYICENKATSQRPASPDSNFGKSLHEVENALLDECMAYALLSRSAAVMASATGNNKMLYCKSLGYKTRASGLLRARIMKHSRLDDRVYWLIFALLAAEVSTHNFENAALHAQMLSSIWQKADHSPCVDLRILHKVFYCDIQRASMSLSRPSFDLNVWMPAQLESDWRTLLPPQAQLYYRCGPRLLDPSIQDEEVRSIFNTARENLEVFQVVLGHPELANMQVFTWLSMRCLLCEGRLLNRYCDLVKDSPVGSPSSAQSSRGMAATDHALAAVCLAGIYWIRRIAAHESLGLDSKLSKTGSSVYTAGHRILERLEHALRGWKSSVKHPESSSHASSRLHLWVLFMGATTEQDVRQWTLSDSHVPFHCRQFAELADKMQLHCWSDVKPVLEGFLYTDSMNPHGSVWFPKLLRIAATA